MNLYSVGHSNQDLDDFYNLIAVHKIDCIIDVRSIPYSKYTSQFNKEKLKVFLKSKGILYAHFGEEFGARRFDCTELTEFKEGHRSIYKEQVNFEKGVKTPNFLKGVERLKKALEQGRKVSLMCSEANPLECHRFSFISRYFYDLGWNVSHIMMDKDTGMSVAVSHKELEKKMILDYVSQNKVLPAIGQDPFEIFPSVYTEEEQRIDAYRVKNKEIGFCIGDDSDEDF